MLSRIAESLYWLGRHVERADCTARILDTYLHLLPAGSWQADHQVIRSLLDSMGLSDDETVGVGHQAASGQLVRTLVFDGEIAQLAGKVKNDLMVWFDAADAKTIQTDEAGKDLFLHIGF